MRRLTVAIGLCLVLAGCTSDPVTATPTATPAPTPVPHPPAPRAQDRDEQAVLDTLATIDPCALVDQPAGGTKHLRQPHMCIMRDKDYTQFTVEMVTRTAHERRASLPRKVIAGAKVDITVQGKEICTAEIPVSFTYAVSISVLPLEKAVDCAVLDGVAKTVITRLGDVAKVRHPADRPDLSKAPCTVLNGVLTDLGEPPAKSHDTLDDLDRCWLDNGVWLEQLIEPGPPDGGWGNPWTKVAGKQIHVDKDGDCQWTWNEGVYSGEDDRLVVLRVDDCKAGDLPDAKVKSMVKATITRLEKPQSPVRVAKLTYGPDEADDPNPGACVDYAFDQCEPYQPTPIPAGAGPATRMAGADPFVTCAATVDLVHARFPDLRPVVNAKYRQACVYVEPDHAHQLEFRVSGGTTMSSTVKPRPVTIAGRPGEYRESTEDPRQAELCVNSGVADERHDDLFWCVTAGAADGPALTPLMTALVTDHFGG